MGWDFCYEHMRKQQVVDYLVETYKPVVYNVISNELWAVLNGDDGKRFIAMFLLGTHQFDGGLCWGYKPMSESMGPDSLDCPPAFVEIAGPTDSPWAQEWRSKLLAHHKVAGVQRALW